MIFEFELFPVDDNSQLFIAPALDEWAKVAECRVDTVIDLEGGLDHCIPTVPNSCLYIYFPILDDELPNLAKLMAVARLGAALVRAGHVVLAHCGLGFNRSALVAGLILTELGMSGPEALTRLRQRRPGALFNDTFAAFLESIGARRGESGHRVVG